MGIYFGPPPIQGESMGRTAGLPPIKGESMGNVVVKSRDVIVTYEDFITYLYYVIENSNDDELINKLLVCKQRSTKWYHRWLKREPKEITVDRDLYYHTEKYEKRKAPPPPAPKAKNIKKKNIYY